MNRFEKLAELFGVEIDEVFNLEDRPNDYKITTDGMYYHSKHMYPEWGITYASLNELLSLKVIKKPWTPKVGEEYFVINPFRNEGYFSTVFSNANADINALNRKVAYKTKEEAINAVKDLGWEIR